MKYPLDYQKPKEELVTTNIGNRYRIEYVKNYDSKGRVYLEENGKTDLQAYYDAQRPQCDMSTIVATMLKQGINPFNGKINYIDGVDDVTPLQSSTLGEKLIASQKMEANKQVIQEYEAKLKAAKAEQQKLEKEVATNE